MTTAAHNDMNPLDIDRFPLSGIRLIEASAGTGKTFTIAALYLRLLLEARDELGRNLDIRDILVVTFTEAATEELRERIRRRLREAEAAFRTGAAPADDPVLQGLLARQPDPAEGARRLGEMLTRLDEAPVYTIHGFCNRTLRDNAFESGALFEAEFITDETALREALMEDFWRSRFYTAEPGYVAWLRQHWPEPRALLETLRNYLERPALAVIPAPDTAAIERLEQSLAARLPQLPRLWRSGEKALRRQLDAAVADRLISAAKDAYKAAHLDALWPAWAAWFENPALPPPRGFELLTHTGMQARLNNKGREQPEALPAHPLLEACESVRAEWEALAELRRIQVLHDALGYLRQGLAERKREQQVLSFNDLLTHLAAALDGPRGRALAETLAGRYPVALIDEFQDTDPAQYRIFDRIYRDRPGTGLFMIGDPKQAIYSFRGADVFTYMDARRSTDPATARFTLERNFRSTRSLVDGVDALFRGNPRPFIYDADIALPPVSAAGRADEQPLRLAGRVPEGLQVWFHPREAHGKPINKNTARPRLAGACAGEIARLLQLAARGEASLGEAPLRARDMAVLVRNHVEAEAVRQALAERGIASVHHSRDKVFETEEAAELERLLQAVAEPENEGLLRAAACTRLMGLTAEQLHAEIAAGQPWEARMEAFAGYRDRWAGRGFLPMLHTLFHEQGVIARVFAQADAERRMTNLLHLGELLQEAATEAYGMTGLLRWLREQRQDPAGLGEAAELRLESDEALVKIVTIHKSKGLQYPVVFLPFAAVGRAPNNIDKGYPLFHRGADLTLDLGSEALDSHRDDAYREAMAESLRLLYVALTRASHCCYLGFGAFRDAEHSGLGYLLAPPAHPDRDRPVARVQALDDGALRQAWQAVAERAPGCIAVSELPPAPAPAQDGEALPAESPRGVSAPLTGRVRQDWRLSSYTALLAGQGAEQPDYDALDEPPAEAEPAAAGWSIYTFPRGARPGTCLHRILETTDFQRPQSLQQAIARQLPGHGFDERWAPVLETHLAGVLATPLDQQGLTLASLAPEQRLDELDFFFPADGVDAAAVDALLPPLPGAESRPALDFRRLTGMLRGFVDLVFECQGRYYLADYKSNHLGHRSTDYAPRALAQAVATHRYDLQYMLYTLALHRYLGRRLPGYDYQRHFGGVFYLFLRGMTPETGNRSGVYHVRPAPAVVAGLDALFAGQPQGTAS